METLLNMKTVASLAMEQKRISAYETALIESAPNYKYHAIAAGVTAGLSYFVEEWVNALQLWFGGYIAFYFPSQFSFLDFLIAILSVHYSFFGLGRAFQDVSDKKTVEISAGRIFYLLDRKSTIDPLSSEGKKSD